MCPKIKSDQKKNRVSVHFRSNLHLYLIFILFFDLMELSSIRIPYFES